MMKCKTHTCIGDGRRNVDTRRASLYGIPGRLARRIREHHKIPDTAGSGWRRGLRAKTSARALDVIEAYVGDYIERRTG